MRQQRGQVERNQLPDRADRVDEFLELLLEPFALAFAIGAAGTPEMNAPPNLVSTAEVLRHAMVSTHRVS